MEEKCDLKCQLFDLPEAGRELSAAERAWLGAKRRMEHLRLVASKAVADPSFFWAKARMALGGGRTGSQSGGTTLANLGSPSLSLRPGERVRVKTLREILATLDANDRLEGMGFMASVMEPYCGRVFTVRKRVDRFFDEKHWKLRRLENVVLLDGVFCEPPRGSHDAFAGCERSCFLFWKEAWLERIE